MCIQGGRYNWAKNFVLPISVAPCTLQRKWFAGRPNQQIFYNGIELWSNAGPSAF